MTELHDITGVLKQERSQDDGLDEIILETTYSKNAEHDEPFNLLEESRLLLNIAIPTSATQLFGFFIFPLTTSCIGRQVGTEALGAFSLASLSGNMTCISIIIGILTASETLQPRAFGLKQYREVGLLAVRSFFICIGVLALPILLLVTKLDALFRILGQDQTVAEMACQWVKIYALGVPSVVVFRITQRFLACQNVTSPCTFGSAIGCFLVHPFILHWLVERFGFNGSALAIVITQCVQVILALLFTILMPSSYVKETWPGLNLESLKDALRPADLWQYGSLSLGGILSLSEWWFWESVCFIAGELGVVPLCVHTIAYQLIPLLFMLPLGISIALSIRIGSVLPTDVKKAKTLTIYSMLFTIVLGIIVSILLHQFQDSIISLFTKDEVVRAGCQKIWWQLCIYIIPLYIFGINAGIMRALGMQWQTAVSVICTLWFSTLPLLIHFCLKDNNEEDDIRGLEHMWSILPLAYTALNIALMLCYMLADWQDISDKIVAAATSTEEGVDEQTEDSELIEEYFSEETSLLSSVVM